MKSADKLGGEERESPVKARVALDAKRVFKPGSLWFFFCLRFRKQDTTRDREMKCSSRKDVGQRLCCEQRMTLHQATHRSIHDRQRDKSEGGERWSENK